MSLRVLSAIASAMFVVGCTGTVGSGDPKQPVCSDGAVESLRCYDASVVPAGQTCTFVDRERTCVKGEWNAAECVNSACTVEGSASCGTTPHGNSEQRSCYAAEVVAFGGTCVTTPQTRTCDNGAWSPDFTEPCYASCSVATATNCGSTGNGQSETRQCYDAAVVPYGSTCYSYEQTRTCVNGVFSPDWPSCPSFSCEVAGPADCDGQPHGTVDSRTCYSAASVPPGQTCGGPTQSRTCNNGAWSPANFPGCAFLTCSVEDGARCGNTLHGDYESRACYDNASVAFGNECTFDWQDRLCNDGTFAPDYAACTNLTCSVGAPPDYSTEHGWRVSPGSCTPSIDEHEYDALTVWGGVVYASYRFDYGHMLISYDAATGAGVDGDQGHATGEAGVVADATGVYSAGNPNQHGYIEKRDLVTMDYIPGFGSYSPGVLQLPNQRFLSLKGRNQVLWFLAERYTPSGYEWYVSKLSGADGSADTAFGTSGVALTTYMRPLGKADPPFDFTIGAAHLYFAFRVDPYRVRIEKRDLQTGALIPEFGEGGLLTVYSSSGAAKVAIFEHLGRLYLGSVHTVFQLNNELGNIVWTYDTVASLRDIIADETGVYVDDRLKLSHDGALLWTSTATAAQNPQLALAGHWLYIAGNRQNTTGFCTSVRTFELLARQSRYDGLRHP